MIRSSKSVTHWRSDVQLSRRMLYEYAKKVVQIYCSWNDDEIDTKLVFRDILWLAMSTQLVGKWQCYNIIKIQGPLSVTLAIFSSSKKYIKSKICIPKKSTRLHKFRLESKIRKPNIFGILYVSLFTRQISFRFTFRFSYLLHVLMKF